MVGDNLHNHIYFLTTGMRITRHGEHANDILRQQLDDFVCRFIHLPVDRIIGTIRSGNRNFNHQPNSIHETPIWPAPNLI